MKLNLGCGYKKRDSYVNVDIADHCQPDQMVDLTGAWPWQENSVEEILFEFSLEQIGESRNDLIHCLREAYRVLKHEGDLKVLFFHPRHDQFFLNPMNAHRLSVEFFQLCSVQHNLQVIPTGVHDNLIGLQCKIDFQITRFVPHFDSFFAEDYKAQKITAQDLLQRARFQNNILHVCDVSLKAIKQGDIKDLENKKGEGL